MVRKNRPVEPMRPEEPFDCPPRPVGPAMPLVSVKSVNGMSGDVVLKKLKFGDKTYNGSSDIELYASDLGLGKAFVYHTAVGKEADAIKFMEEAEHGDVVFCKEDKFFYVCLGEGNFRRFPTKAALEKYSLVSETASKITLACDYDTYEITATLFDKDDNPISSSTIDLPIEDLVKEAYYDKDKKCLVIVFQNGQKVEIPIGDLVDGFATKAELEEHAADRDLHINAEDREKIDNAATQDWVNNQLVWEKGEGENSIQTKGTGCRADGANSVAEGELTSTVKDSAMAEGWRDAKAAHAEGGGTLAGGNYSHAEGNGTVTNNPYEHAEGHFNVSHYERAIYPSAGNTIHSIGIGSNIQNKKNAFEVMQNGDAYMIGIGEYDGKDIESASTIQDVINGKQDQLTAGENVTINNNIISAKDTTYTAGENIEIDANNVIKAISNVKFDADFTVTNAIGLYAKDDIIPKDTNLLDVIKNILTAVIPQTTTLYIGATDNIPTSISGLTELKDQSITDMLSTGIVQNIKSGNPTTEEGQYPVIACPKAYALKDWQNNASKISYMETIKSVNAGDYVIYYMNAKVYNEDIGGEDYLFTFKEN